MRLLTLLALCGLSAALVGTTSPAADSPDALLKPLAPTGTAVRARLPIAGAKSGPLRLAAQVPRAKKKGEYIDVTVAFAANRTASSVPQKALADWGYTAKVGTTFKLSELRFPGVQAVPVPKEKDGLDVIACLNDIELEVVEPPTEAKDKVYRCDILLTEIDLFQLGAPAKTGDTKLQALSTNLARLRPRVLFDDEFLELTVPPSALKRPGTNEGNVLEVTARPTPGLVTVVGPTDPLRDAFARATVNGKSEYPHGAKTVPVNVWVDTLSNWPTGIVITAGVAYGCKVDWKPNDPGQEAIGTNAKSTTVPGTISELRLGFFLNGDPKKPRDFVLKDVPVVVDRNRSESAVWLGPKFFTTHFADAMYAADDKGVWKMHARCDEAKYLVKPGEKKP